MSENETETGSPNGRQGDSIPEGGVLAALPRARPQRASARRTAARTATPTNAKKTTGTRVAKKTAAAKQTATAKKPAAAKQTATAKQPAATRKRAAKPIAKPAEPPGGRAPNQGYEPEEEVEVGKTVNPPSGVELVESVADIVGELANSGIAAGGKLLKDALSLLRRT